jgi:prephenate dehydrogenase
VASNPAHVDDALDRVQVALAEIREAVAREDFDRLEQILTQAKRMRDALGS